MDLQAGGNPADYIGKRLVFRVTEYGERGRNIVLSRRDILEEERAKTIVDLKKTLKPGDVVEATVRRLAHFGAFADIGGIEGLIPMSELAWHRVGEAADVLNEGERIKVRILNLDWDNNRISLSLKQTLQDPWDSVGEQYPEESSVLGTVSRLANFGAFVELEPGVEGLVHISNMGMGRRINHPREVLSEGEQVQVRVLSVDAKARRIGLELAPQEGADAETAGVLTEGDVITGTIDSVKDYGVFVALPGGKSGLLHVSEISDARGGELRHRFPIGATIEVQVKAVDPDTKKISLSTKTLKKAAEASQFKEFEAGKGGRSSLGTLGDLLKEKMKE
jgi:small subunit ribosomal protein S1